MFSRAALVLLCALLSAAAAAAAAAGEEPCPRREPGPNVKVLALGSKVTLSCSGRVIVDGVDVTQTTSGRAERDEGDHRGLWDMLRSTSKEGYGFHSTVTAKVHGETNMATVTAGQPGVTNDLNRINHHLQTTAKTDVDLLSVDEGAATTAKISNMNQSYGTTNSTAGRTVRSLSWQVQWKRNNRLLHRKDRRGDLLHLGPLNLSNSGNYSCHLQERLMFSVKIIVWDPLVSLEKPSLSCFRKSPTSKIRCDWTASQPVVPVPQCHLILKKGIFGENMKKSCMYSEAKARCWCVLDVDEKTLSYVAFLCVSNVVGNVTSPTVDLHQHKIVRPDSPYNISVQEKVGKQHRLIVSWRKPLTWKADFYHLMYQLRYSVSVNGELKGQQEVLTKKLEHTITDALPQTRYMLQVRAREEFDIGQWSEWRTYMYNPPWRAPNPSSTNNPMVSFDTNMNHVGCFEGSGMADITNVMSVSERPQPESQMLLHVSWAIGVGLLLMIIVLLIYIMRVRHRTQFMCKLPKLSCSSQAKATAPPSPPPPKEEENLMFPELPAPTQNLDSNLFQEEAEMGEGIHLNNMGYFLAIGN
ncbi:interleukin-6 receptor subunit alpha isoform X2 [Arapaima gigas]